MVETTSASRQVFAQDSKVELKVTNCGRLSDLDKSYETTQKDKTLKEFEAGQKLSKLIHTDKATAKKQFDWIDNITNVKESHGNFDSQDIYSDIKPFVETDIWVEKPDTDKPQDCYINANRIQSAYQEGLEDNLIIAA